jgi:hypothetical protein
MIDLLLHNTDYCSMDKKYEILGRILQHLAGHWTTANLTERVGEEFDTKRPLFIFPRKET